MRSSKHWRCVWLRTVLTCKRVCVEGGRAGKTYTKCVLRRRGDMGGTRRVRLDLEREEPAVCGLGRVLEAAEPGRFSVEPHN